MKFFLYLPLLEGCGTVLCVSKRDLRYLASHCTALHCASRHEDIRGREGREKKKPNTITMEMIIAGF